MRVTQQQVPPHLYPRYGVRPNRGGWFKFVGGIAIAILAAGLIYVSTNLGAGTDVKLITWQAKGPTVTIKWSLQSYQQQKLTCVLRAVDSNNFDLGFAVVSDLKTTGAAPLVFEHQLRVRGEVFSVDTPACETKPSLLPNPHFRPGLLPPAQIAPLRAPWQ